jgi:glycosyltransferase involved in cell wall biosynthesis
VLVIVQGDLADRPQGPEIRGLEIARSFAVRHDVTIAASTEKRFVHDGMPVVPRSRRSLWREMCRHDVVVGPVLPPHLMSLLAPRRCIRVSDLYDPVDLEMDTIGDNGRVVGQQRTLRRLQLRWSDVVVSANERQRERARADLQSAARDDVGPLLIKVAMGLPEPPEPGRGRPLRNRLGISDGDPVVLWWGTAWRWLDAEGAVRAIAELVDRRPDIRLVITAGRPRNRGSDPLNRTDAARDLARELGLLDRNVFFFTEWIALEERHRYLADADLGITLNTASPESSLAARTRYMDYLWASVPSVLTEGDELADEMAAAGAARLVAPHDVHGTATAIEQLLDDSIAMRSARDACRAMADGYRWSSVIEPLVDAVEELDLRGGSARDTLAIAGDSAAYYARRVRDGVLDARSHLAEARRRHTAAASADASA